MKTQSNISKMLSGLARWYGVDEFAIAEFHNISYLNPSFDICGLLKSKNICCTITDFQWAKKNVKKPIESSSFVLHTIDGLAAAARIPRRIIAAKVVKALVKTLKKGNRHSYFIDADSGNFIGENIIKISKINSIDEFKVWCDLNI